MTRDNNDRLNLFVRHHIGRGVIVRRLALNMDQVEQYNPPPNPAKLTDSRAHGENGYLAVHGEESWELDALDPPVIAALIRDAVDEYRDMDEWQQRVDEEARDRSHLSQLVDNWADVEQFLQDRLDDGNAE